MAEAGAESDAVSRRPAAGDEQRAAQTRAVFVAVAAADRARRRHRVVAARDQRPLEIGPGAQRDALPLARRLERSAARLGRERTKRARPEAGREEKRAKIVIVA